MANKKYTNGSWVPASYRKYGTETDTITTLPATVIGDGTPISSYTIKGNMEQSGTPTPENPIYPSECGDLVASGEHAGQYKLPITLGNTTTNIYLGEVQTARRIKKLVLDGTEGWLQSASSVYIKDDTIMSLSSLVCSHFVNSNNGMINANTWKLVVDISKFGMTALSEWKTFLAQQYANGTPVTVWYILTTPTTGIVNEPIRKIGNYVDSVSGTSLATSGTAQEFDVDTTLKPSEVDMTYHGWHEHDDTKYST